MWLCSHSPFKLVLIRSYHVPKKKIKIALNSEPLNALFAVAYCIAGFKINSSK